MKYQMISLYSFIILNISTLYIIGNSEVPGPKDFTHSPYDLTLVGEVRFAGSIRRLPIAIAELFKDDATINHIPTSDLVDLKDVSKEAAAIFQNPDKTPGNVALIFEGLWNYGRHSADFVPQNSFIKIAYSLLESSSLYEKWVSLLNEKFDLVVVADEYYRSIYQESGVTIPIFVQPHGTYIEDLLNEPVRETPSYPFVFGSTAFFENRKNQELLVEAFQNEFGNDPAVKLVLHGRPVGDANYLEELKRQIEKHKNSNIEVIQTSFSDREYKDFFKSLDCYILISKGEGFSISPREALALGKPCILSNNTAHKTICETGHVYTVPSEIKEPMHYRYLGNAGFQFNCQRSDVQKALREVYTHYETYLEKAQHGRNWVKQYCWHKLKPKFHNLIKPKQVLFGAENIITDDYIMTSSEKLYAKYMKLSENVQSKPD